jgi:DNA-directed RNA polymerase specialized sigma24 family protein
MGPILERSRERAEQVLSSEYAELRHSTLYAVRGKLAARGVRFDRTDLEAFYNQAWHGLYLKLAEGEEVSSHAGFLVHAAYCRAIEETRRVNPGRRADDAEVAELGFDPELESLLDDHIQLKHFMEGMRERLTERERQAAALCYIQGSTRPEAAAALGVSPKRMEKLMDSVSLKIGALLTDIREGDWCQSRASLMKAYAFGVLEPDGERHQLAAGHLRECPGCRSYVRGMRGIAAVAPPAGLPIALVAALGAGGAATGGAAAAPGSGATSSGAGAAGSSAATSGSSTAAAGAGAGGLGVTGIAAAAAAVVVVAGAGGFAVAGRSGDEPKSPPPAARVVAATPVAAAPVRTAAPKKTTPKKKAKPKKAARKKKRAARKRRQAPAATRRAPAPAPVVTPAPTVAQTPTVQQQQVAQQPSRPVQRAAPRPPTGDAAQEFGFEK